jgi:tetratricopeptide (TPR) repeat protein
MEFDLIPQLIIVFSVSVIIFILGRNIPKIKDVANDGFLRESNTREKEKFLYLCERLVRRIRKEKYQEKVNLFWVWLEKVLRKVRIGFLRFDNKIVSLLGKLREKNVGSAVKDKEGKESVSESGGNRSFGWDMASAMNAKKINSGGDSSEKDSRNKSKKEKEYIDLILKNPNDIRSYWKLGIIYSRKKNYRDAISCFCQILKVDPTYTKARKKIADLIERMEKRENGKKENEEK